MVERTKKRNAEELSVSEISGWALSIIEEILCLPVEELLARLKTSMSGLSSEEAEKRLRIFGFNEPAKKRRRAAIFDFLSHFRSPLVIILLIAGLISGFLERL